MPVPHPESEEVDAALPPPVFTTPTKPDRNAGAGHVSPDAEGTNAESDADVEKQFDKPMGKKHKFAPFHEYRVVGRWATSHDSLLEPAEIEHQIKMLMKKFMQDRDSRLMIALGKDQEKNKTDKALWKQQPKEYWNSRTDEMVHTFKCPMDHRCRCKAKVRIITGKGYKRLEFHGTHDETSHAVDYSKTLKYKQIVTLHDAVMVAPKQSAAGAVLRRNLMQAKGNLEQHKHMDPYQLRVIQ